MEFDTIVEFINMMPSDFVEMNARNRAEKLQHIFPHIISCRVSIEAPHHSQSHGQMYKVGLLIKVPGDEIVVSRLSSKHQQNEDVYVALRDAFDAARRQLLKQRDRMKNKVKRHQGMPVGEVIRIFPYQGYGFARMDDGREVYFDMNSVVDAEFDDIEIGQHVRFAVEQGNDGPQASSLYAK